MKLSTTLIPACWHISMCSTNCFSFSGVPNMCIVLKSISSIYPFNCSVNSRVRARPLLCNVIGQDNPFLNAFAISTIWTLINGSPPVIIILCGLFSWKNGITLFCISSSLNSFSGCNLSFALIAQNSQFILHFLVTIKYTVLIFSWLFSIFFINSVCCFHTGYSFSWNSGLSKLSANLLLTPRQTFPIGSIKATFSPSVILIKSFILFSMANISPFIFFFHII